jgi:poly-gamma-glutamate synthesis protein (capsule biosynthesis protein)
MRKTRIITLVVCLALGVASASMYFFVLKKEAPLTATQTSNVDNTQTKSAEDKTAEPKKTRFIATGDFIGHDAINKHAKTESGYSYAPFMDQMKPLFSSADIRFCNQATLVGGEQFAITGYPSFNSPAQFAKDMAGIGCNVINTASNHSADKSQAVIDANVTLWNNIPNTLAVAGQYSSAAEQQKIATFEVDGMKYAFLAYTTYSNSPPQTAYGVNMYSRERVASQVATAKAAGAQFIVISMRWGTEYSQSVNAYQVAESQYLADLGVQLVLGHGPHVLEPVKLLTGKDGNETVVWYSLGNFLHAQLEPETLFNGVAVMDIDPKTAKITAVGFLPIYMHYEWTSDQAARQDLLARKNFELVPLEKADDLLAKSLVASAKEMQLQRIQTTLNTFTQVPLRTLAELGL